MSRGAYLLSSVTSHSWLEPHLLFGIFYRKVTLAQFLDYVCKLVQLTRCTWTCTDIFPPHGNDCYSCPKQQMWVPVIRLLIRSVRLSREIFWIWNVFTQFHAVQKSKTFYPTLFMHSVSNGLWRPNPPVWAHRMRHRGFSGNEQHLKFRSDFCLSCSLLIPP